MSKTRKRSQKPGGPQRTPPAHQPWLPGLSLPDLAIWVGLILSILLVYSQVSDFDFTSYDDDVYVYQNAHVQAGLTLDSVKWALRAVVVSNWAPVTMLSHLVVAQLFHLESGMHHLANVFFHALAALLLFASMKRATGQRWPSAFVAFMFALHPLHVGSVAWVAERKDVLSAFFWFLGLYAYVRYTERPGVGRYLAVAGAFCLGFMSKSMLVTFPFALLLFDVWPLRRMTWPKTVLEKLPLFALSAAGVVATYLVQQTTGAVKGYPMGLRIENSLLSYVTYIWQTLWPTGLAIFYPFPKSIPVWEPVVAGAFLAGISALVILARKERPYLAVGWFWYLGTLVPVIGLVQVGLQAHADRYTYIPMVGLSVMLAWGVAELVKARPQAQLAIAGAACACCVTWMVLASKETSYWQNSPTLFRHAIAVTDGNWQMEYELAFYMATLGRRSEAIAHYQAAVRIRPDYPEAQRNLGMQLLTVLGRQKEALEHLQASQRLLPQPDLDPLIQGLGGGKK